MQSSWIFRTLDFCGIQKRYLTACEKILEWWLQQCSYCNNDFSKIDVLADIKVDVVQSVIEVKSCFDGHVDISGRLLTACQARHVVMASLWNASLLSLSALS